MEQNLRFVEQVTGELHLLPWASRPDRTAEFSTLDEFFGLDAHDLEDS